MTLSYATKARIARYLIPLVVIVPCALLGYKATHNILAAPPAAVGISVAVDQPQYKVGQDVIVTLSNATSVNVYVNNNCPGESLNVYRFENNSWIQIHATADSSKCNGEPHNYQIPANSSVKTDYRFWPTLFANPGRYRIVANVEGFSQWPYADFTVVQ